MDPSRAALWSVLVCLALAGQIATSARLASSGLWRKYPAFAVWDLVSAVKAASLTWAAYLYGYTSREYVAVWQPTERVATICLLFVGWEAFRLTAKNYPTLNGYGREAFAKSFVIALAVSMLPFAYGGKPPVWHSTTWIVAVLIRTATLLVGLCLFMAVRRVRSVTIPEQNNLQWHRRLILLYCAGQAVGMFLIVATHDVMWVALHLTVTAICWILWSVLLTADGEALEEADSSASHREATEKKSSDFMRFLGWAASSKSRQISAQPQRPEVIP